MLPSAYAQLTLTTVLCVVAAATVLSNPALVLELVAVPVHVAPVRVSCFQFHNLTFIVSNKCVSILRISIAIT